MAPIEKKPTYVAPGKLGLSRGQGLKTSFLPGFLAKAPSSSTPGEILSSSKETNPTHTVNKVNHVQVPNCPIVNKAKKVSSVPSVSKVSQLQVLSKMNQHSNVLNVNKMNLRATNEGSREKEVNQLHSNVIQSSGGEVYEKYFQLRSTHNASLSNNIEKNASQVARQNHKEVASESAGIHEEGAFQDDYSIRDEVSTVISRKRNRKPDAKSRGVNMCKKVASLKKGQKLGVEFYNNGPVGENQKDMTRHMGKLVRDRSICPVRVHSWDEIDKDAKDHMWKSVLNKFAGNGVELDRKTTLDHMKRLWQNWRGILNQLSIIKKGGPENALKETPNDLTPEDWEWLVKEHFCSDAFKKVSARNSDNRGNLTMLHRTGSMPFRQIIWDEMGVKDGKDPPPISAIFKKTRQRKSGNLDELEKEKYEEIVSVETENPSLTQFEVVEKCFGEQDRGSVVCFGFGMKPKYVRGPLCSRADLTTRLQEKQKENDDLRRRMDEMEKSRQEESEANSKKINDLEGKLNMLMTAYMQQSSGSGHLYSNLN